MDTENLIERCLSGMSKLVHAPSGYRGGYASVYGGGACVIPLGRGGYNGYFLSPCKDGAPVTIDWNARIGKTDPSFCVF